MKPILQHWSQVDERMAALYLSLKAAEHLKAVFWLGIIFLTQISRSRFKQSKIS